MLSAPLAGSSKVILTFLPLARVVFFNMVPPHQEDLSGAEEIITEI
jgi:hypothetical protein